jgi:glycerol uptake facilitator-like aquaporin
VGLSIFGAEVIGTALLILLGNGVVACVLLNLSKGQNSGWIVITFGWGMAVMTGAFAVGQFSGAHLNPAVTVGFAVAGDTEWSDVPEYFAGEFVGAFIGATLVWLAYLDHWKETEDPGLKLACYSTAPAIRNPVSNLITEIIGTFVLVFGILAFFANEATRAGDRALARWSDRLRDQPGARSRPADHARDPPDRRQGRLGLELRVDPGGRAAHRRCPRRRRVRAVLPLIND